MKKNIVRKVLILAACAIMTFPMSACGNASNQDMEKEAQSTASQEDTEDADSMSQENTEDADSMSQENTEDTDSMSQDIVSIDNLSLNPITIFFPEPDNSPSEEGWVIEASAKNNSDESMLFAPVIEATVDYTDNYGDGQTAHIQLSKFSTGCECPYSIPKEGDGSSMPWAGLAPKEEKTVRYYIHPDNVIMGYDLDNNYNDIQINDGTLTDITLVDVNCEICSKYVIIPVSEWIDQVKYEHKKGSFFGVDLLGEDLTGEIVNNTNDRWEEVYINLDISIDGPSKLGTSPYRPDFSKKGYYIGIGKSFSVQPQSDDPLSMDISYDPEKGGHNCEILSGIMCYKPENNQ